MNCPNCQTVLPAGSSYCSACGNRLSAPSQPGQPACAVHPETAAIRTCSRCGNFACGGCLVVLPGGVEVCRACEVTALRDTLPWDRREQLGTLRAWWQTSVLLMKSPTATFAQIPQDAPLGSSLLFAAIATLAGFLSTLVLYGLGAGVALFFAKDAASDGAFGGLSGAALAGIGLGIFVGYLLLTVAMTVVWLMVHSALDQLALKLVKAEPAAWTVTVRGGALAMAPYLIGLIPLCGLYVFPIWSLVLKVFAYRALHRTTGGKAAAGALLPVGVMILGVIALYAVMLAAMFALVPSQS